MNGKMWMKSYRLKCSLMRSSRMFSGRFPTHRWRVSLTILLRTLHLGSDVVVSFGDTLQRHTTLPEDKSTHWFGSRNGDNFERTDARKPDSNSQLPFFVSPQTEPSNSTELAGQTEQTLVCHTQKPHTVLNRLNSCTSRLTATIVDGWTKSDEKKGSLVTVTGHVSLGGLWWQAWSQVAVTDTGSNGRSRRRRHMHARTARFIPF